MADETIFRDESPFDLSDLPEELLRNSLLLFSDDEESDESETSCDTAPAAVTADTPALSQGLSLEDAPGPTYHQLVKREIAAYLRARTTASDRIRKTKHLKIDSTENHRRTPLIFMTPDSSSAGRSARKSEHPVTRRVVSPQSVKQSNSLLKRAVRPDAREPDKVDGTQRQLFPVVQETVQSPLLGKPFQMTETTKVQRKPAQLKPVHVKSPEMTMALREPSRVPSSGTIDRAVTVKPGLPGFANSSDSQPRTHGNRKPEPFLLQDLADKRMFAMELSSCKPVRCPVGDMAMEMTL